MSFPSPRTTLFLLLFLAFAWPAMMGLHELGHAVGALLGGGTVVHLAWHPLFFSRTDVHPNPHPLLTVWGGPIVGVLLPLVPAAVAAIRRRTSAYAFLLFAGFCLLANGAYIGLGPLDPLGDTQVMLENGTPDLAMIAFGVACSAGGLCCWHLASPRLTGDLPVPRTHLLTVAAAAAGVVAASGLWSVLS